MIMGSIPLHFPFKWRILWMSSGARQKQYAIRPLNWARCLEEQDLGLLSTCTWTSTQLMKTRITSVIPMQESLALWNQLNQMRRLIKAFCFPCYIFNFFACLTAQGLIKPIQLCRSLDGYLFSILIKLQTTLSLLSYYGYHYNCYCSQTMVWRRYVYQVIQKKSRNSLPDRISLHLLKYLPTVQENFVEIL